MPAISAQVEDYLVSRRAMGFDLRGEGYQLRAFARFANEPGDAGALTLELLLRWVQGAVAPGPVTAARRVEVLRPFLKYCRQFDAGCPVVPWGLCGNGHRRLSPHIYTVAVYQKATLATLRHPGVETVFLTSEGRLIPKRTIHNTFDRLRRRLGWVARGGQAQPRIHDLRHTFICQALLRGQQDNRIDPVADAISTYVGHAKVSDTYWYISATPELMSATSQRFSRFSSGGCQ